MTTVSETLVEFPFEPKTTSGAIVDYQDLDVRVDGPANVTATAIKRGNEHFISFTTTVTGDYKISIKHNGESLVRTPVTVTVKLEQDDDPNSTSRDLEDFGGQEDVSNRKHPVRFQVDAKDKQGNPIQGHEFVAEIAGPEAIHGIEINAEGGKLLITFETTVTSGEFVVGIKYKGEHIYRSPYTVSLTKSNESDKKNDVATLDPEDDYRTIQFKVDARMNDGTSVHADNLTVGVDVGPDVTWDPKVAQEGSQILVTFKTRTLGNYIVSVLHHGVHIAGSPFNLQM
jgi:hypothetical protein